MAKQAYNKELAKRYQSYKIEFNRKQYFLYTCRLRKDTDKDVIDMIYSQENSTDYIRKLVEADIKKSKKKGKK